MDYLIQESFDTKFGRVVYARVAGKSDRYLVGNVSKNPIVSIDNGSAVHKKSALVLGAGGFIGGHLVKQLISEGYWVRGVDIKSPEFENTVADDFIKGDLRDIKLVEHVMNHPFDEIYQLAADMGGAGFIFTGDNDFNIMHNSATINLNVANIASDYKHNVKIFYSSSACAYPAYNQEDADNPKCSEESAYPAAPDSEYGWEKLFSERMFLALARNHPHVSVRIARFHNVFGPNGTYDGGREKSPAALCRKIAKANDGDTIEIWGDGKQTRSFLYIDDCIHGVRLFMNSQASGPLNIGSDEMVTINMLAGMIMEVAQKTVKLNHIDGPLGVRGRTSDNTLIKKVLGWAPGISLKNGLIETYTWIHNKVNSPK